MSYLTYSVCHWTYNPLIWKKYFLRWEKKEDLKGIIIMMLAFTKLNKSLGDNKKLCKCGMDVASEKGEKLHSLLTDNFAYKFSIPLLRIKFVKWLNTRMTQLFALRRWVWIKLNNNLFSWWFFIYKLERFLCLTFFSDISSALKLRLADSCIENFIYVFN